MTILVCPLSQVMDVISTRAPERIVSLLDPEFAFPEAGPAYQGRHLRLRFHDVHLPGDGQVAPTARHVDGLLAFLSTWERSAPILIHCRAGISRSTATAFIAACLYNPHADEGEIAAALRRASPLARPNGTLIELADAALSRSGRMSKAMKETGRGLPWIEVSENVAFEMPSSYTSSIKESIR
jgi:predicted protein tyrosine phosphatase